MRAALRVKMSPAMAAGPEMDDMVQLVEAYENSLKSRA
jgi:hypothetical protein